MLTTIKEYLKEQKADFESSMNDLAADFANDYDYKDNGWINDDFIEYADSRVDIYTSDLFEWAKDNYSYIEDYVEEFQINPQNFDFIRLLQGGQFMELYEQLCRNERKIKQLLYINKMLNLDDEILNQELDEEVENRIEDNLYNSWCEIGKYDEYENIINETFGWN